MRKMKALTLNESPENRLEIVEINLPELQAGYALIKLQAAALNHRDLWIRDGLYPNIKFGSILGSDGCGTVEAVADSSNDALIGKEVIINPSLNWGNDPKVQSADFEILGMPSSGTFAEYISVPVKQIQAKPSHLSPEEAAALPLAGLTAYRAVFAQGRTLPRENVLITGVGGGVAQFAFQFAKAIDASVYVTSGSDWKFEKIKMMEPAGDVNYNFPGWDEELLRRSGGFDLIIDSAGGDQVKALLALLKPGGKFVFYGATHGNPTSLDWRMIFWKQLSIQGTTMGSDEDFRNMLNLVNEKQIFPVIDSVCPFDDILHSFAKMESGQQFGKLVVKF